MEYLTDNSPRRGKGRAVKLFLVFMAFMLACSVISRGIYAYQMPRVEAGVAGSKSIEHTVQAEGTVQATRETAVVTEAGIRISEICVRAGQNVEKGDVLLKLSTSDLEKLAGEVEEELQVEETRLAALEASSREADEAAQTAKERAQSDLERTKKNQDSAVSDAQNTYDAAKKALADYPSWKEYRDEARAGDSQYQSLKRAAEQEGATKEDKAALKDYQTTFDAAAKKTWEAEKQALKDAVAAGKSALSSAKSDREEALLAAQRALKDASQNSAQDSGGIAEEENTIRKLTEQKEVYEKLLEKKGEIVSEAAGAVGQILLGVGDRTTDGAVMTLADGSQGWEFQAAVSGEEAEYLAVDDTVSVSFDQGNTKDEEARVTAMRLNEEGQYDVTVKLTAEELVPGQVGTLTVTRQSGPYSCCIPLSALYSDNNKSYILLIRETDTILGTEYSVVKREVTVQDKNSTTAALEEGTLGNEEQFVVYASKAVFSGDKVRFMEAEDE